MDTVTEIGAAPRRTKPRGRHPDKALSAAFIRSASPGRHADGNGLFLYVKPEGTRSWIQRIVIRGRRREMGLGSVALVSLAEARELALANRKLARSGGDPLTDKRRVQGVPTPVLRVPPPAPAAALLFDDAPGRFGKRAGAAPQGGGRGHRDRAGGLGCAGGQVAERDIVGNAAP